MENYNRYVNYAADPSCIKHSSPGEPKAINASYVLKSTRACSKRKRLCMYVRTLLLWIIDFVHKKCDTTYMDTTVYGTKTEHQRIKCQFSLTAHELKKSPVSFFHALFFQI